MCSAVRRRMLSNGTISSPDARATGARPTRRGGRRRGGAGGGAGAGGAARRGAAPGRGRAAASSTSLRVMRPPSPVPRICAGSRPCSAIMRRTSGDVTAPAAVRRRGVAEPARVPARAARRRRRRGRRRGGAGAGGGAAAERGAARRGRGRRRRALPARARRRAGAGGARRAASEITASRAPTVDGVAFGDEDLGDDPAAGAGTSESTLSVDTSNSGSSAVDRSRRPA